MNLTRLRDRRRALVSRNARPNDRGAALILALGVMLLVGLVSSALLGYVRTSVGARTSLEQTRARQYAADGAVEHAIAQVRALAAPGAGEAACGGPYSRTIDSIVMRVECVNNPSLVFSQATGAFVLQRNVVFTACQGSAACTDSTIVVRAQVNYEVPSGSSTPSRTFVQSWSVNR